MSPSRDYTTAVMCEPYRAAPSYGGVEQHSPAALFAPNTKGLLNAPGQNNCFLNSAVQVSEPHLGSFFLLLLRLAKPVISGALNLARASSISRYRRETFAPVISAAGSEVARQMTPGIMSGRRGLEAAHLNFFRHCESCRLLSGESPGTEAVRRRVLCG